MKITEGTLDLEISKRFPASSLNALREYMIASDRAGNEREVKHVAAFLEDLITKAAYAVQDAAIVHVVQTIEPEEKTLLGALGPSSRKWWRYHQMQDQVTT